MEVVRNEREFKRQKDETAAIFERLRVKSKEVYRKMSLFFYAPMKILFRCVLLISCYKQDTYENDIDAVYYYDR